MSERISAAEYNAMGGHAGRRKPPVPHEHFEQVALVEWSRRESRRVPALAMLFAIPNGGHRRRAVAGKLKAEGVRAGVPDLMLPVARGKYHGLFIELKAERGRPTSAQHHWIQALAMQGYYAVVCFGWEAAKETIEEYLAQ